MEWAKNHSVEIVGGKMIILEEGVSSTVSLDVIDKIYLNRTRGRLKSIVFERKGGMRERLPQYTNLEKLVEDIKTYKGNEAFIQKNWLHV